MKSLPGPACVVSMSKCVCLPEVALRRPGPEMMISFGSDFNSPFWMRLMKVIILTSSTPPLASSPAVKSASIPSRFLASGRICAMFSCVFPFSICLHSGQSPGKQTSRMAPKALPSTQSVPKLVIPNCGITFLTHLRSFAFAGSQ